MNAPSYSPRDIEESDEASFVLEATPEMCCYCFDILVKQLVSHDFDSTKQQQRTPDFLQTLPKTASSPLFITWEKEDGDRYALRGCIGTLSPRPLTSAIGEYALTAALRDRRFDPIRPDEIRELRVAVSLLVKYEQCDHVHDWEVGVHGILIRFTDGLTADYSATYLPEVAKEQRYVKVWQPTTAMSVSLGHSSSILIVLSFIKPFQMDSSRCSQITDSEIGLQRSDQ